MDGCSLTLEPVLAEIRPVNLKTLVVKWHWHIICTATTCVSPARCGTWGRIKDEIATFNLESSWNPFLSDLDKENLRECVERSMDVPDWDSPDDAWFRCSIGALGDRWYEGLWSDFIYNAKPPPHPNISEEDIGCTCIAGWTPWKDRSASAQEEFIRRNTFNEQLSVLYKREIALGNM
tara:strand:+ start:14 stop:547 length:534 start_codon:yes stop_codon:yes gene_type:complete